MSTFNSRIGSLSLSPTHNHFTYDFIVDTYLQPNRTFRAADLTGSLSDARNTQIQVWYDEMIPGVKFWYDANTAIANVTSFFENVCVPKLNRLQVEHVEPLQSITRDFIANTTRVVSVLEGSLWPDMHAVLEDHLPALWSAPYTLALQKLSRPLLTTTPSVIFGWDRIQCRPLVLPIAHLSDFICNAVRYVGHLFDNH
jgi:hypothetical protein